MAAQLERGLPRFNGISSGCSLTFFVFAAAEVEETDDV
jgi:hypothetical protein